MKPLGTLILIDGLNIVRRVYEANPMPDSLEKAEAAARNSLSSIKRVFTEIEGQYGLVVFDTPGKTWRHELYTDYKKDRKPMPQVLRDQLEGISSSVQQMGCQTHFVHGAEADDVINTLALKWISFFLGSVVVVSTDKDLAALVKHGVRVRDHFAPAWRDEAWVRAKFGVAPTQVQDFLALMGDSTDGIPGVSKVGAKTAAKLLDEHGDLETVIAWAATASSAVGKRIAAEAEMARLSRKLVELRDDYQLGMSAKQLRLTVGT